MIYSNELHKKIKNKTVISHVGHRDLIAEDIEEIKKKLDQKLKEITRENFKTHIILTGLAEGADTIFAEAGLKLNIEVLVLCIEEKDTGRLELLTTKYPGSCISALKVTGYKHGNTTLTDYEILSRHLVQCADVLIALWDGIYNSKKGGTAHTIDFLLNCNDSSSLRKSKKAVSLCQLVVPREKNKFPSGKHFNKFEINLPQAVKLTWVEITLDNAASILKPYIIEKLNNFFRKSFRNSGEIIRRFIIPLLLAISVIIFGMIGYNKRTDICSDLKTVWNAFFYSSNLITLNVSVFDYKANFYLNAARLLGGILAVYAFALAFSFALGYENFLRLKFFFFRLFGGNYFTVIGINEMAFDIAANLRKKLKIILLHNNPESYYVQKCKEHRIWLIKGNPFSAAALRKTYFETAKQVYVVTDNDEDNFRSIQEMDQLIANKEVRKNEAEWFVHLTGSNERSLLQEFIRFSNRTALTSFSIPENTARRLLTKFPVNRYNNAQQEKVCVIIIGFTNIGEHIAVTALQQGIYLQGRELEMHIYYNNEEEISVKKFKRKHSFLFDFSGSENKENLIALVQKNNYKQIIHFHSLFSEKNNPAATEFSVAAFVIPSNIVSIYVCLQSGIKNASFLSFFLPKLCYQVMKKPDCDVAVFWFYNFPDRDEEIYLRKKINALAPNLLVESFGNYLYETTLPAIANETMDNLARQVALWYYFLYDYKTNNERNVREADVILKNLINEQDKANEYREALQQSDYKKTHLSKVSIQKSIWYAASQHKQTGLKLNEAMSFCWKSLSETDREGNRQAADHIWVKLREAQVIWELSNQPIEVDRLEDFWTSEIKKELAVVEHRRWTMMKLMEGWQPFNGSKQEWKNDKELLKKQKLHNLLISFEELERREPQEKEKDFHQIEGIPFFLNLFAIQKLNKWISLTYNHLSKKDNNQRT